MKEPTAHGLELEKGWVESTTEKSASHFDRLFGKRSALTNGLYPKGIRDARIYYRLWFFGVLYTPRTPL
jgi:hypothetical protein